MDMHRFSIYKKEAERAILFEKIEFDPSDICKRTTELQKKVLEISRDQNYRVAPENPGSAWLLMKPKPRGRNQVTPEIVLLVHQLRVEKNLSVLKISIEVQKQTEVDISIEIVKNILQQKIHTDIPIPEDLRQKVRTANWLRGEYSKIDPDRKKRIYREFRKGRSGTQIAKEEELSSNTVNKIIRKKYGYRKENRQP